MPPRRKQQAIVKAAGVELRRSPEKITGGNSIGDQEWIAATLADGSLHPIDPELKPDGFLYDVIYQWDALADEVDEEFFEYYRPTRGVSAIPKKCNAPAYIRDQRGGYVVDAEWQRLRRQCVSRPARGANVCYAHGSQIPVVKAAAQRRLAEASEVIAMRLINMTDPKEMEDAKVRLGAINSALDRAGIKGTVEVEITTPGFQRVLEKMFGADTDDE
jgi:hypothetical protein